MLERAQQHTDPDSIAAAEVFTRIDIFHATPKAPYTARVTWADGTTTEKAGFRLFESASAWALKMVQERIAAT